MQSTNQPTDSTSNYKIFEDALLSQNPKIDILKNIVTTYGERPLFKLSDLKIQCMQLLRVSRGQFDKLYEGLENSIENLDTFLCRQGFGVLKNGNHWVFDTNIDVKKMEEIFQPILQDEETSDDLAGKIFDLIEAKQKAKNDSKNQEVRLTRSDLIDLFDIPGNDASLVEIKKSLIKTLESFEYLIIKSKETFDEARKRFEKTYEIQGADREPVQSNTKVEKESETESQKWQSRVEINTPLNSFYGLNVELPNDKKPNLEYEILNQRDLGSIIKLIGEIKLSLKKLYKMEIETGRKLGKTPPLVQNIISAFPETIQEVSDFDTFFANFCAYSDTVNSQSWIKPNPYNPNKQKGEVPVYKDYSKLYVDAVTLPSSDLFNADSKIILKDLMTQKRKYDQLVNEFIIRNEPGACTILANILNMDIKQHVAEYLDSRKIGNENETSQNKFIGNTSITYDAFINLMREEIVNTILSMNNSIDQNGELSLGKDGKGISFLNYFKFHALKAHREIAEIGNIIRLPPSQLERIKLYKESCNALNQALARNIPIIDSREQWQCDWIANRTSSRLKPVRMNIEQLRKVAESIKFLDVRSLDSILTQYLDKESGDQYLYGYNSGHEFLRNQNSPDESTGQSQPEKELELTLKREDIESVLSTLSPRERDVLKLRYGLDDGREKTLEEIGQIFNVTKERIRQIEAKGLRKLRHPNRNSVLKEYITRFE